MTVKRAIVMLRASETQQQFATRLGMSISGLQNYERGRVPEPKQLLAFLNAAESTERGDLAEVFRCAFLESLGLRRDAGLCIL